MSYPCAVCGYLTRSDASFGTFEICPVCFWEDDPVQATQHDHAGGANRVSLRQARENYARIAASEPDFLENVRAPAVHELPRVPLWTWGTVRSAPADEPADEVRIEPADSGYLILTREGGHEFDTWVEHIEDVTGFLRRLDVGWT